MESDPCVETSKVTHRTDKHLIGELTPTLPSNWILCSNVLPRFSHVHRFLLAHSHISKVEKHLKKISAQINARDKHKWAVGIDIDPLNEVFNFTARWRKRFHVDDRHSFELWLASDGRNQQFVITKVKYDRCGGQRIDIHSREYSKCYLFVKLSRTQFELR